MKTVCAVIVNYHRESLSEQAIASVLASRGVQARVVLIDNESDGRWVRERWAGDPSVRTIVNRENLGFGAACNQGIEQALADGADGVMLLNNDATVQADALALLIEAAEATGMAAPKIVLPDGRLYAAGGVVEVARARAFNRGIYQEDHGRLDAAETMDFASACALMISRRALGSGARFYEPYFLYYEDADLCLAMKRAGFRVRYVPEARALHRESASTAVAGLHRLDYFNTRNRLRFLLRQGTAVQKILGVAYLAGLTALRSGLFAMRGCGRRAASCLAGLVDGLRGRLGPGPYRSMR